MRYAVFDVETTGLGSKDEVIQFAAILTDDKFRADKLFNFYCYTQQRISAKAAEVHKINQGELMQLSGGKSFEDQMHRYPELFKASDIVWVEYNTNGFDRRLVNQSLTNNGHPALDFGKTITRLDKSSGVWNFNICRAIAANFTGGTPRRLAQAAKLLPYDTETINRMYGAYLCKDSTFQGYHRADYDAFVTWLLLYQFNERFRL